MLDIPFNRDCETCQTQTFEYAPKRPDLDPYTIYRELHERHGRDQCARCGHIRDQHRQEQNCFWTPPHAFDDGRRFIDICACKSFVEYQKDKMETTLPATDPAAQAILKSSRQANVEWESGGVKYALERWTLEGGTLTIEWIPRADMIARSTLPWTILRTFSLGVIAKVLRDRIVLRISSFRIPRKDFP